MRYGFIGAGISALTCAAALRAAGHDVTLFDKGRLPGGRMSTRRVQSKFGEACIDHGAPYFDAIRPAFREAVAEWRRAELVSRWPEGGPDAWVGIPNMDSLVSHLAGGLPVRYGTFVNGYLRAEGGFWQISTNSGVFGPFDAIIVAVPAEQAAPLLALYDFEMACAASSAKSRGCWAGLLVFEKALPASRLIIRNAGPLALALCNRAKPLRRGPESWLVHASADWSEQHMEKSSDEVAMHLVSALQASLDLHELPEYCATAHRWRYASSDGVGRIALWNENLKLGACGDWVMGATVECAWMSGTALARRLVSSANAGAEGGRDDACSKQPVMTSLVG